MKRCLQIDNVNLGSVIELHVFDRNLAKSKLFPPHLLHTVPKPISSFISKQERHLSCHANASGLGVGQLAWKDGWSFNTRLFVFGVEGAKSGIRNMFFEKLSFATPACGLNLVLVPPTLNTTRWKCMLCANRFIIRLAAGGVVFFETTVFVLLLALSFWIRDDEEAPELCCANN